jgi:hypothetical protein
MILGIEWVSYFVTSVPLIKHECPNVMDAPYFSHGFWLWQTAISSS